MSQAEEQGIILEIRGYWQARVLCKVILKQGSDHEHDRDWAAQLTCAVPCSCWPKLSPRCFWRRCVVEDSLPALLQCGKHNSTHFSPLNLDSALILVKVITHLLYTILQRRVSTEGSFSFKLSLVQQAPGHSMIRELLPLEVHLNTSLDSECKK